MSNLNRRTRKALAGLVAASALASGAIWLPQFALANIGTVSATTALNVRLQPSTSSQILGVLSAGEQVERRGDPQGEWTPIRYRGQDAWVFSAYVSLGNLSSAAGGTGTATAHVNVRASASTLSPVLGVLRTGTSIAITGAISGGWVPVDYNGRAGFVYAAYLSLDSSTSAPPVAAPVDPAPVAPAPADPAPAPAPSGPVAIAVGTATTTLNVRSGPSTGHAVLYVLRPGQHIDVRGEVQDGWTPVILGGREAWVASRYLSVGGQPAPNLPEPAPAVPVVSTTTTAYTTTGVNLRTGPSIEYRIIRVLATNTAVQLTGVTQSGFSQVLDEGQHRWISTTYLSSNPVTVAPAPGGVQGPAAPTPDGSTTLNTGGSVGLDQLRDTTKQVVYAVRNNFPYISTMYGWRRDPLPDHPSGRAVDIMMPGGANDQARGDDIAAYLQANADSLNIEYLIWRQRIWINGQSGWTWMADRGGVTANHYDHIHVTVRY